MSPSNDHGFPGMEHTRGKSSGAHIHIENPEKQPDGPTKDDRRRALELATDIVNHNNFSQPGLVALGFAKRFAQYLHDGTTDQS